MGSEREEELQEERGLPQLEARLQHGPEHVCPPQVRTPTGQCSRGNRLLLIRPLPPPLKTLKDLSLFTSSLLTEQPERPGSPSSDDCHPEPRPGPQRSQQLLHPEVGQDTRV